MHIYFIGIGGTGIGPLALIASQAGYDVSGSDSKASEYTSYLQKKGISLYIDQSGDAIKRVNEATPINWVISTSAITRNNPDHPELVYARAHGIRITERDAGLNEILATKHLQMIAAAGTHGKTTTTAMLVWAMKQLKLPISYSVGAKTSFAEMGHYEPDSTYFVYECDEFHRNFLQFKPLYSIISGIAWDHHEVYPTREDYNQAFRDFVAQSQQVFLWESDAAYAGIQPSDHVHILSDSEDTDAIKLYGLYNRRNARLIVEALHQLTGTHKDHLFEILSSFPGVQRRMEELSSNLFTDYAHTPEKITGCLHVAAEIAKERKRDVVVVYEPLTNRRQHYIKDQYTTCFNGVRRLYWVPSYLSREDPTQPILSPEELIKHLPDPSIAQPASLDGQLWEAIQSHIRDNSIVVCMSGGGGNSLDEWLRAKVRERHQSALPR